MLFRQDLLPTTISRFYVHNIFFLSFHTNNIELFTLLLYIGGESNLYPNVLNKQQNQFYKLLTIYVCIVVLIYFLFVHLLNFTPRDGLSNNKGIRGCSTFFFFFLCLTLYSSFSSPSSFPHFFSSQVSVQLIFVPDTVFYSDDREYEFVQRPE